MQLESQVASLQENTQKRRPKSSKSRPRTPPKTPVASEPEGATADEHGIPSASLREYFTMTVLAVVSAAGGSIQESIQQDGGVDKSKPCIPKTAAEAVVEKGWVDELYQEVPVAGGGTL